MTTNSLILIKHMKLNILTLILFLIMMPMTSNAQNGLISIKSQHSVTQTADRFEQLINDKGLTFFARINHTENAKSAKLELRPTQVILFGNPVAGTALMNCGQTIAIDLPQKALFWEDNEGTSWVSYNDPHYLKDRHSLQGCEPVIEKVSGLLSAVAISAASE